MMNALASAGRAQAVEGHVVGRDPKLWRHELAEIFRAAGDVEDPLAFLALEMMVMPLIRPLVPNGLAGNRHLLHRPVAQQTADRAIDGRNAQAIDAVSYTHLRAHETGRN